MENMHVHLPCLSPRVGPARACLVVLLCIGFVSTVVGCDIGPVPPEPTPTFTAIPSPTATLPPRPRGGTLTVRLPADIASLNPWLTITDTNALDVSELAFSGLVRLDNHLQPQP